MTGLYKLFYFIMSINKAEEFLSEVLDNDLWHLSRQRDLTMTNILEYMRLRRHLQFLIEHPQEELKLNMPIGCDVFIKTKHLGFLY